MRKKGLERYLIISSLQYGAVSELIEQYSLGLIDLEDLFD